MKHFQFADWVDYVRGVGSEKDRVSMDQHLLECAACESIVTKLRTFSATVAADRAFEPPQNVVRCARAIFTQFRPERVRSLPRLLTQLVEDPLRQPLPAGVRGNTRATRQALYQAGRAFVDLRIEQRPGNPNVVLVGQLLCPDHGAAAHLPVVLTSGTRVLTMTTSNDHGEFQFEYVPAGQMRLHIPVEHGTRRMEISLNRLMPKSGRNQAVEQ